MTTPQSDSTLLRAAPGGIVVEALRDPSEVEEIQDEYNITCSPYIRKAVIFRNKTWDNDGQDVDCKKLQTTLENLGFTVVVKGELNEQAIVEERNDEFHKSSDCLLIVVFAHKGENDGLSAKGGSTLKSPLWEEFMADKWKTLAGKPKIFLIQVCRGPSIEIPLENDSQVEMDNLMRQRTIERRQRYCIPAEADLIVHVFNTHAGCSMHRDSQEANLYIEELCAELEESSAVNDLVTMLTRINDRLTSKSKRNNSQIPSVTSTLRHKFYFQQPNK